MRLDQTLRSLGGSVCVYVVVAACGAASDGAGGAAVAARDASIVDAISNPVKDAKADELPPEVYDEACDKTGTLTGQGVSLYQFAEHLFPEKTTLELSAVRVLIHPKAGSSANVNGNSYTLYASQPMVADGRVAFQCGPNNSAAIDRVTFILPK